LGKVTGGEKVGGIAQHKCPVPTAGFSGYPQQEGDGSQGQHGHYAEAQKSLYVACHIRSTEAV
jgi:hypothetical protein